MKNDKMCKQLCNMVDMYQDSEHPINEILHAMKLNIQDIFEENLTKHDSSFIQDFEDILENYRGDYFKVNINKFNELKKKWQF